MGGGRGGVNHYRPRRGGPVRCTSARWRRLPSASSFGRSLSEMSWAREEGSGKESELVKAAAATVVVGGRQTSEGDSRGRLVFFH